MRSAPYRCVHIVVPPQQQQTSCLPGEQIVRQLMGCLRVPYYAALLRAARQ